MFRSPTTRIVLGVVVAMAVPTVLRFRPWERAAGFNDTAILQINLITSWFNDINRVADGLGVGRDEV